MSIRFRNHPSIAEPGSEVRSTDPAGAYLLIVDRKVQIIVVGAMQGTPGAYRVALNRRRRRQHRLESAEFLPIGPIRSRKKFEAAQDRGFVSLIFAER